MLDWLIRTDENGMTHAMARRLDITYIIWNHRIINGPWSGVQSFGGGIASDPAATVYNGTLFVFAIGSDGTVKYWFANGGAWSGVQTIGSPGTVSGGISATVYNGVLYVFARGTDGTIKYYFADGGPWSGMQIFGGGLI